MTMGVGVLTLPALIMDFGVLGGAISIFLGFIISLISF